MDIGNMLNTKNAAAAAAAEAQLQQHLAHAVHLRGGAPGISADHSSAHQHRAPHLYSNGTGPLHPMTNLPNDMKYSSHPQANGGIPMMTNGYMSNTQENGYHHTDDSSNRSNSETAPKVFTCTMCPKSFARRSDLARHERTHTGVKPHRCDFPNCGKSFIQRSALTVHYRTHTGERPHGCETCGRTFGDSSSLARHRRIHSGMRPYRCPYASCQKTFTRRTTLTRHQNHHPGTVEEASAERNAKLSSIEIKSSRHSDGDYSETGSNGSSASPGQRPHSVSPGQDLPPLPNMARQTDYGFMSNGSIPPHLRSDFAQASPRSSPGLGSPSMSSYGITHSRPSMTSHPNTYGPPQPLEPPANNDHRSTSSVGGSPHMSAVGWGSPQNPSMPSPSALDSYGYADPSYGGSHPLYFSGSNIRRPQSTEPDNYDMKPRHMGHEWNPMPVMQ